MPVISAAKLKKLSVSLFEKMGVPQACQVSVYGLGNRRDLHSGRA